MIDLSQSTTLHTVFFTNRSSSRHVSYFIGTCEIRLGDNSGSYSTANSVVWQALYDGGFFPIGTDYNGRYLTIRRTYINSSYSSTVSLSLNEVRVY